MQHLFHDSIVNLVIRNIEIIKLCKQILNERPEAIDLCILCKMTPNTVKMMTKQQQRLLQFQLLGFTKMDVLLLREKDGENDKYHTLFEENGYNGTSIPVLDFMFYNLEIITDIISNISDYSGVIFTSKRAITAFSNCCSSSDIQYISELSDFNIYVVGHSSAASLTKLGLKCIGENTGNAEELSKLIILKEQEVHKPFLFPCGNLAKETIPTKLAEKKIPVKSVSCYKTVPNEQFISKLKLFVDKSIPDYIAFFSPSGIDFYFTQIKELLGDITVVKFLCIGRTTEKALKNFDADVYGVAKKPTAQGLLDALKEGS